MIFLTLAITLIRLFLSSTLVIVFRTLHQNDTLATSFKMSPECMLHLTFVTPYLCCFNVCRTVDEIDNKFSDIRNYVALVSNRTQSEGHISVCRIKHCKRQTHVRRDNSVAKTYVYDTYKATCYRCHLTNCNKFLINFPYGQPPTFMFTSFSHSKLHTHSTVRNSDPSILTHSYTFLIGSVIVVNIGVTQSNKINKT